MDGQAQRVLVPRSSEYPAFRRDHWQVGRPLVRSVSMMSPCGQSVGESSHVSWRPYRQVKYPGRLSFAEKLADCKRFFVSMGMGKT